MKKVYESQVVGFDENAEQLTIFEIESEEESHKLFDMEQDELCELLDVQDDYNVPAGAVFHRYSVEVTGSFVILTDSIGLNV